MRGDSGHVYIKIKSVTVLETPKVRRIAASTERERRREAGRERERERDCMVDCPELNWLNVIESSQVHCR